MPRDGASTDGHLRRTHPRRRGARHREQWRRPGTRVRARQPDGPRPFRCLGRIAVAGECRPQAGARGLRRARHR